MAVPEDITSHGSLNISSILERKIRSCTKANGRPEAVPEWKGMAPLSYPPMPPILSLVILLILTILVKSIYCCDLVRCYDRFKMAEAAAAQGLIDEKTGDPQCIAHRTHLECIISIARSCRINIQYHATKQGIIFQMNEMGCRNQGPTYHRSDTTEIIRPIGPIPCTFMSKNEELKYKHCGLFGDPHLKTFNDKFQTCKVEGAWTLVNNKHILVQVTNDPVKDHVAATATSKLTVVIKKNEDCAANEYITYIAQTNNLPATFLDGNSHHGPTRSVEIVEVEAGKYIEIFLRFIFTTIRVRQIGRYFTFAIKMPEEIVEQSLSDDNLQLCVSGCPRQEQIDYKKYLSEQKMSSSEATQMCRDSDVVDFYFDSCVFDLMTTGDKNFTVAAYKAWQDLIHLTPSIGKTLPNRTDLPIPENHSGSGCSKTNSNIPWNCALIVIVYFLFQQRTS